MTGVNLEGASVTDLAGNAASFAAADTTFSQLAVNTNAPTPIQTDTNSFGTTTLAESGNNYFLDGANGTGPELKDGGTNVVVGQFGGWEPIGAAETATGYEVAWKVSGSSEYIVWYTDSNGNFLSQTAVLGGSSPTLEALEPSFNQDLNGDGTIGVPSAATTVIQTDTNSFGTTVLTDNNNNYFLNGTNGAGPELKDGGNNVVAGQFGGWEPIGAAETATGYEVAWKVSGSSEYIVWYTDSNGNFLSQTTVLAGNSSTLEALEPSFNQDLNGDGTIGIPTALTIPTAPTTPTSPTAPSTVIQTDTNSFGTTTLAESGNNYFLDGANGTGPELKDGGTNVVVGQFGGWEPIGAAETATGYEVAWKVCGFQRIHSLVYR